MFRFRQWFRLSPAERPRVFTSVYADADMANPTYWLGILLSAGIATFGLVENSPAVIIGAMLISPLMGPIMATGLGLAAGDMYLALKALMKLVASILVAVMLSGLLVWVLPFHSMTNEILSRINPTLLDLGIALLSGVAGSVAVNRAGSDDGVTTLPGVAIAVALMPPLCTVGFGVGSGWQKPIIVGAGLLFMTNIVAIVFSAFLLFLIAGMNSAKVREGLAALRVQEGLAHRVTSGRFRRVFAEGTQLRWRVLLLLALLGAIAFPLQQALRQLASEAVARDVAQAEIAKLVPRQALVSQQTEVGPGTIAVRLISTVPVDAAKQKQAEEEIQQRSGREASLSIDTVASQHELAQLMQRMNSEQAAANATLPHGNEAMPRPLSKTSATLRARVQAALTSVWPAAIPIADFEIELSAEAPVVTVHYTAAKAMDPLAAQLIQTALQQKLDSPKLMLTATRVDAVKVEGRRERARRE